MGLRLYGDPAALDRLAQRLQGRADEVRQHADDHVRRGQSVRWVSASASSYRDRVAHDRAQAYRAADELDRAAAALRAHAHHVRQTLAQIARIERDATAWFAHQARGLAKEVDEVVDAAGQGLRKLVEQAPWRTWPVTPDSLPTSGDVRWLEVGRFLRRQGVL